MNMHENINDIEAMKWFRYHSKRRKVSSLGIQKHCQEHVDDIALRSDSLCSLRETVYNVFETCNMQACSLAQSLRGHKEFSMRVFERNCIGLRSDDWKSRDSSGIVASQYIFGNLVVRKSSSP